MLKFPAVAQVAPMQSLRSLVRRQNLVVFSESGVFGTSRVLSSRLAHRLKNLYPLCYLSKSSFNSGAEGWAEEVRGLSAFNKAMESSASSTACSPSMNNHKSNEGEEQNGREADEATRSGVNHCADSSGEEEVHEVLTYFDPVEGKIMTSPAAPVEESSDDTRARGQVEDSTAVEAVEEKTSRSPERGGMLTYRTQKSEDNSRYFGVVNKSPKAAKISWVCGQCGYVFGQWWGICPSCQTTGSITKFSDSEQSNARRPAISEAVVRSWLPKQAKTSVPVSLKDVNNKRDQSAWRIPLSGLFGMEVSMVLGGGIVPGSLVLIGGDPGVGKSTLLLQIAAILAEGSKGTTAPVVYISGEESIEQIGNRAIRMRITTKDLFLHSCTDIEDILDTSQKLSPRALIVDSIQTVYFRGGVGSAGGISQVRECTAILLQFAKQTNIPVLIIGHVTKTGDLAGPRTLEHIVDTVLYMEGERYSSYRLLRSVKNRFGSTDELGVFEMSESGLQAVSNPSELFLTENFSSSNILAGIAIAVIIDGSRAFLMEVQALCVSGDRVKGQINGISERRADMLISVLMKQAGLKLEDSAIFLNVVTGLKLTETAGDLAAAAAICSSFLEFPIPNDYAFIGEIGLGGELRAVPRMDKRLLAVEKLGFKRCIIPQIAEKSLKGLNVSIQILGCRDLKEVINLVFQPSG